MYTFEHQAQYYETDQMGIIHHSNYIRWFESARIGFMDYMGVSYVSMEEAGIASPVLNVSCEYKTMTRFGDTVLVIPKIKEYNGIIMELSYEVIDKYTEEVRALGSSKHCFLNSKGRPISLERDSKEFHQAFIADMK
ncbi:MAG: acyl-CoA thioesterase [Eubacteriales bacterium]|nr:acyl-CoA thioesterase [Eubacteriales bacterium]